MSGVTTSALDRFITTYFAQRLKIWARGLHPSIVQKKAIALWVVLTDANSGLRRFGRERGRS
jgi:hypothetical protein